ncbi:hypothetical protein Hanom_Chr16g01491741 [Helianthus anomalus]
MGYLSDVYVHGNTMRRGVLFHASYAMNTRTNLEVIYHPRMCASAFIVPYDKVMEALTLIILPECVLKCLLMKEKTLNIYAISCYFLLLDLSRDGNSVDGAIVTD